MSLARETKTTPEALPLRPAEAIMTPAGLSAFKASRLSFLRCMIGRMVAERWRIAPRRFDLDAEGRGTVIYEITTPDQPLYFVVFSDNLPPEHRTDRIIENHYDGEAFLCIGEPDDTRIEAQRGAFADFLLGRSDIGTLGWTRVNRSGRVFDRIVAALADGRQPDIEKLASAGYLMRNNGFWGSGRHGTAVMAAFSPQEFLGLPYHADLLTLFMWRHFSVDLVEHIARCQNPEAARLDPELKRLIGVGNASGLGLIPYVIRHPKRINHWVTVRETAIARCKAIPVAPDGTEVADLERLIARAIAYYASGIQVRGGIFISSAELVAGLEALLKPMQELREHGTIDGRASERPWTTLCEWAARHVPQECLELLHSSLIEIHAEVAESLKDQFLAVIDGATDVEPGQRVAALRALLQRHYGWALALDLDDPEARKHFWYLSLDNLEPRHGLRGVDPGEDFETFVDVTGEIQALDRDLAGVAPDQTVGEFLFGHPQHRTIVERVQSVAALPYAEVRANVLSDDFEPCHLIRFLLTQYGMEKLDPQSRLWVRGTFLQGAPTADDIAAGVDGDWIFPMTPARR